MAPKPPWQKVLYLKQPYEDNYVGEAFLDSLVLNAHVQHYDYVLLCRGAMGLVQQCCLLSVFLSIWHRVQGGHWRNAALLCLDGSLLALGYASELAFGRWRELTRWAALGDALRGFRTVLPLWLLSPVLQTLTRSWSDDTIVAVTFALLLVHVARYDYGGSAGLPGGAVAVNAAMLAATILASRLETSEQVFAFTAFAMEVFAIFPRFSLRLKASSPQRHAWVLTPLLALLATLLLSSVRAVALLLGALAAMGFLGPALLVWAQRYKAEIQGPWDIAHVQQK